MSYCVYRRPYLVFTMPPRKNTWPYVTPDIRGGGARVTHGDDDVTGS